MESNKIENDVPPTPASWKDLPGELVMRFEAGEGLSGAYGFEWQVKKLTAGKHYPEDSPENKVRRPFYFEASTPYRHCVYQGASVEEAIANLIRGMSHLSRDGAMNPSNPNAVGAPPIQHAISILTERLLWTVEQRQNHLVMGGYADSPGNTWPSPYAAARFASVAQSTGGQAATTLDELYDQRSSMRYDDNDDEQSKKKRDAVKREREAEFVDQMVRAIARDNEVVAALATAISALARVKDL